jgi:virginiamycin B lyase
LPPAQATSAPKAPGKATLSITIPQARAAASSSRRPAYVSPATTQLLIDIQQTGSSISGYPQTIGLTPTSNGCSSSLASTQCNLTLALAPGSYTATLTTEDASNNPLSAAQSVPFTIVAGTNNAINLSLGGIATSIAFLPGATSTLSGNVASGYALSKCQTTPQSASVYGVDADGNLILGSGAPTPALASNDVQMVVATPPPTSPNTFALTLPNIPTGNTTAQLTASLTPADGGSAPAAATIDVNINSDFCNVFSRIDIPTGGSDPEGIAVGSDGNPWFTETQVDKIGTVDASGNIEEYQIPTGATQPRGIAPGPDGNLWFAEYSGEQIGKITTAGAITEYPLPELDNPIAIAAGPDGNMWFGGGTAIDSITTGGTFGTETPLTVSGGTVNGITSGPDGALWFTETNYSSVNEIGRITTGGSISETALPAGTGPERIVSGSDGALWFTEFCAGMIGRITTSDSVTTYSPGTSYPYALTSGLDGTLWFGSTSKIGNITTAGVATLSPSAPSGYYYNAATAPDGSIWFIDYDGHVVHLQ